MSAYPADQNSGWPFGDDPTPGQAPAAEVGLDDLFGRSAEPGGRAPGRMINRKSLTWWLFSRLAGATAVSAVIYGLLHFMGMVIPFALLVVTIFVAAAVRYILVGLNIEPLPRQLTGRGIRPMAQDSGAQASVDLAEDGIALAAARWTRKLGGRSGEGSPRRGRTPGWLGELVDERLRLRHGFTRATDPARARERMGEQLWATLHNPSASGHTPRDMATIAKWIEEL